jgi:hypothetical protein
MLGTVAEYLWNWNNCHVDLQDNRNKFNPVRCSNLGGGQGCENLDWGIVQYYTPIQDQNCGNTSCTDDTKLYPDLRPLNDDRCKRGYNWGILNKSTMFIGQDCGDVFINDQGDSTTCRGNKPSKCVQNAGNSADCDYTPTTCTISFDVQNSEYNASSEDPCKGKTPPTCIDIDGNTSAAVCNYPLKTYSCPMTTCNASLKPSNDAYCNYGIWEKKDSGSSSYFYLIMLILLVISCGIIGVYIKHGGKWNIGKEEENRPIV